MLAVRQWHLTPITVFGRPVNNRASTLAKRALLGNDRISLLSGLWLPSSEGRLLADSASSTKASEADIREDRDELANDRNGQRYDDRLQGSNDRCTPTTADLRPV